MKYSNHWWERWLALTGREVPELICKTKTLNNHNNYSIHQDARKLVSQEFKHAA